MIVRIMGEGQFELRSELLDQLNQLDNEAVDAVAKSDEARYKAVFAQLLDTVRASGKLLPETDLTVSDVVLPHSNLTFAEAKSIFAGEGVIPG